MHKHLRLWQKEKLYNRPRTSATGRRLSPRQEARIPYALSRSISEIHRSDLRAGRATNGNDPYIRQLPGEALRDRRHQGVGSTAGYRADANYGLPGRRSCTHCRRKRQTKCKEGERSLVARLGQGSGREYLQSFFIRIGARYRRIKKLPRVNPRRSSMRIRPGSCKNSNDRQTWVSLISTTGDESHICTEGYVPYVWQFRGGYVYVPSERGLRLNIFGMTDRNNRYDGFSTTENMTAETIADFFDRLSLRTRKNKFVVLDNASVHRSKLMRKFPRYGRNVDCSSSFFRHIVLF